MKTLRIILFWLALPSLSLAQEIKPTPGTEAPRGIDPAVWMDGVRSAYRESVVHEQHTITVTPPNGEATSAVIVTRTWPSETGPRTWMQLGPFNVLMETGRVAVAHRHNRKTVLVREGGEGLAPLMGAAPRIPLPQLVWIAGAARGHGGTLDELAPLGAWFEGLKLEEIAVGADGLAVTARGQRDGDRSRVEVRVDESNRVVEFVARVRASEGQEAWGEIRVSSREIDKTAVPTWDEFVATRERVSTLGQLKAEASQVPVGVVMPSLGLMTRAMVEWDFAGAAAAAQMQAPGAKQVYTFVLYNAARASAREDGASGFDAVYRASRQLRRTSAVSGTPATRLHAVPVGVVGLDDFRPDLLERRELVWNELVAPLGPENGIAHAWTSVGAQAIDRFVPESGAVLVLTDASLKILGVIPLDGRSGDADSLAAEIVGIASPE